MQSEHHTIIMISLGDVLRGDDNQLAFFQNFLKKHHGGHTHPNLKIGIYCSDTLSGQLGVEYDEFGEPIEETETIGVLDVWGFLKANDLLKHIDFLAMPLVNYFFNKNNNVRMEKAYPDSVAIWNRLLEKTSYKRDKKDQGKQPLDYPILLNKKARELKLAKQNGEWMVTPEKLSAFQADNFLSMAMALEHNLFEKHVDPLLLAAEARQETPYDPSVQHAFASLILFYNHSPNTTQCVFVSHEEDCLEAVRRMRNPNWVSIDHVEQKSLHNALERYVLPPIIEEEYTAEEEVASLTDDSSSGWEQPAETPVLPETPPEDLPPTPNQTPPREDTHMKPEHALPDSVETPDTDAKSALPELSAPPKLPTFVNGQPVLETEAASPEAASETASSSVSLGEPPPPPPPPPIPTDTGSAHASGSSDQLSGPHDAMPNSRSGSSTPPHPSTGAASVESPSQSSEDSDDKKRKSPERKSHSKSSEHSDDITHRENADEGLADPARRPVSMVLIGGTQYSQQNLDQLKTQKDIQGVFAQVKQLQDIHGLLTVIYPNYKAGQTVESNFFNHEAVRDNLKTVFNRKEKGFMHTTRSLHNHAWNGAPCSHTWTELMRMIQYKIVELHALSVKQNPKNPLHHNLEAFLTVDVSSSAFKKSPQALYNKVTKLAEKLQANPAVPAQNFEVFLNNPATTKATKKREALETDLDKVIAEIKKGQERMETHINEKCEPAPL